MEYPAPVLKAPKGRARVQEVADLADESCRNWVRIWREGETFLNTEKRNGQKRRMAYALSTQDRGNTAG